MPYIDTDYHRERARNELDAAYYATHAAAAEAHMRLSALHMKRLSDQHRARAETAE